MERMTRILCLVALLGVLCMTVSEGGKTPKTLCTLVCKIHCKYGKVMDGFCKTCECKSKPKCGPICRKFCPNGFVEDKHGCPICVCKPPKKPVCPTIKCGKE
uniref:BPTI/Kunitz domain-containing protein 4-like n=1 Tax=Crassostrea virginica TaxID=6565 RepID=A0A8B8EEI2_CRAVI|nr:BPTI/Kunitz domain-containing protein 4-like [Crassostrea virginica]